MEQSIIDLIKFLGTLPNVTLWTITLVLVYKSILYLSTTGALVYLGKEVLKLLNSSNENLYYHGYVQLDLLKDKSKAWLYNRNSLAELSKEGIIEKFYITSTIVSEGKWL